MNIIIGHSNMDIDCIAALVLAHKLHPDHTPVQSGTIHPNARNLHNLYETQLGFMTTSELSGKSVESVIIVDTRSSGRVREFLDLVDCDDAPPPVLIYDHHPADSNDFPNATLVGGEYGSCATILGELLMERKARLSPEEATIALAGIFSDTGNFTHQNVGPADFRVASWLLSQGASLPVVSSVVRSLRQDKQIDLFHDALNQVVYQTIHGHLVGSFTLDLPRNTPGLGAVAERVFEVENPDALFAVFGFEKPPGVLVVARSKKARIKVNRIMADFGGGGHERASSAMVKGGATSDIGPRLWELAEKLIVPALRAGDIMSHPVLTLQRAWSLREASVFLEKCDHTGAPVVDEAGDLVGFLTLRDIMKGRKKEMMHAPVKGFMTGRVFTCGAESTLRDLEQLFFTHNVGHLPVVDGSRIVGIVTRSDYLRVLDNSWATATG